MNITQKEVRVVGIQMDLGASRRGVNMGPLAIRYAGLTEKLTDLGFYTLDKGDIVPEYNGSGPENPAMENPKLKYFDPIFKANQQLFRQVSDSLEAGAIPVILGGDHSVAAGSISATSRYFGKVGVIWIDAHGDFNNAASTPSGNMHGMPLSALCGFGPDEMIAYTERPAFVNPDQVALIGSRDIDSDERARLIEAGIHVFSMHDIDRIGMAEVMKRAIIITSQGTEGIHVSFDIDAITPQEAPGVGTPVHSGLTVREAFLAAEMVAESGKLIALDMVEVNPILDHCNKTGALACELILSFLGKTLY